MKKKKIHDLFLENISVIRTFRIYVYKFCKKNNCIKELLCVIVDISKNKKFSGVYLLRKIFFLFHDDEFIYLFVYFKSRLALHKLPTSELELNNGPLTPTDILAYFL